MKTQNMFKTVTMTLIMLTLLSCKLSSQENKTPTITKTFDLNQPGTLNAQSSGGGIDVLEHERNEVEIQVFIRKNGKLLSQSDDMVDEILEDYDLDFSKNGSDITAIVKRKSHNKPLNNVGISLTILVPREMSCSISSSGGGIKISGVKGTHNFSSSGGGVKLANVAGTTRVGSSGGGVRVSNYTGDIDISSSGGGVSVDDATGSIVAHSSGGGVHLDNIHGTVDAGSSGGGVKISGELASVKASSSGGSVHVDVSNLTKELSLHSSGGGVDAVIHNGKNLGLDLDLSSERVNIELHNFTGKSEKNCIKGSMNGGGIPFYIRSSGGSVDVEFVD